MFQKNSAKQMLVKPRYFMLFLYPHNLKCMIPTCAACSFRSCWSPNFLDHKVLPSHARRQAALSALPFSRGHGWTKMGIHLAVEKNARNIGGLGQKLYHNWLVVWNIKFIFHFIYGMSSFPLTFIFFRGYVNHQTDNIVYTVISRNFMIT